MVSKKQRERAKLQAFREGLDAAMAGFTPPTLEEMLTIGDELFKNPGSRNKVRRRSAGAPRVAAKAGSKKSAKSAATPAARHADDANKSQRRKPNASAAAARGRRASVKGGPHAKQSVVVVCQDDPSDEHSSNQTLAALLSDIRRRRPRSDEDPDWVFVLGGKRDYISIQTQGPSQFSGQHPVWRGRTFAGCMSFDLRWADVGRVLERVYDGLPMADCFAGHAGSFAPYER